MKTLGERLADQRQRGVALGIENVVAQRRLPPRHARVALQKIEIAGRKNRALAIEQNLARLHAVEARHARMIRHGPPRLGRDPVLRRGALRAVTGDEEIGLKRALYPALHRRLETRHERRHPRRHRHRAEQARDRQPMPPRGIHQMTRRELHRHPPRAERLPQPRRGTQQNRRDNPAAKDPAQRRRVARERQPPPGKAPRRQRGQQRTQRQQRQPQPAVAKDASPRRSGRVTHQHLRGRRARGLARGHPPGHETARHRERQRGREFGAIQMRRLHAGRVVERIHRAADEPHGKLRARPAQQRAQQSAHDAHERGLDEPRALDRPLLNAERAQDCDLLAPPHDRAVERLKNEIHADQQRDQREDREVHTERARHQRGILAAVRG